MPVDLNALMEVWNGDLFVPNDLGEAEVYTEEYFTPVFVADGQTVLNAKGQFRHHAAWIDQKFPAKSDEAKNAILAARFAAFKLDLLRPADAPALHHCIYNDCGYVQVGTHFEADEVDGKAAAVDVNDVKINWYHDGSDAAWVNLDFQAKFAKQATNFYCFVAYIFRWRGHHYKDDFKEVFSAKWSKNTNANVMTGNWNQWQDIMTVGSHGVFPDVLDEFWHQSVLNATCCNAFAIRYTVPAAGQAAYFTIWAGVDEFKSLFPRQAELQDAKIRELGSVIDRLVQPANRWMGGINRNRYGGSAMPTTESKFAALAAAVQGVNSSEDHGTKLGEARSLQRVARGAALTNSVWRCVANGMYSAFENADMKATLGRRAMQAIAFEEPEEEKKGQA